MQLVNPLEQQNAVKTLYSEFVSPVCAKYGLTRIELDILLFLANNMIRQPILWRFVF